MGRKRYTQYFVSNFGPIQWRLFEEQLELDLRIAAREEERAHRQQFADPDIEAKDQRGQS